MVILGLAGEHSRDGIVVLNAVTLISEQSAALFQYSHCGIVVVNIGHPNESEWPVLVGESVAACTYIEPLSGLDYALGTPDFPERSLGKKRRGSHSAPDAPIVAAFLVKLDKGFESMKNLDFYPLMAQTAPKGSPNLGHKSQFGALDGAFDTFYAHEYFTLAGGFAAVP